VIYIRTDTNIYMIDHVKWIRKKSGKWIPVFLCWNKDGDDCEINPSLQKCKFISDDDAIVWDIAFATVGEVPLNQRLVTENDESNADYLEALNKKRDIEAAIEYILNEGKIL